MGNAAWRTLTIYCLVLCIALSSLPVYAQTDAGDYTVGDCSQIDREALRSEIQQAARNVLETESGGIDVPALVQRQWNLLDMDAVIDREVARAVGVVAADEGYLSRLWSGWSADKAQEFATRIANDAFGAPSFHAKIEELAAAIATEIAQEIDADFARAASAAFLCMKAYIGSRYSETLFSAFAEKMSVEVDQADVGVDVTVDVGVLDVHGKTVGGLGLIIVSEIARRITQRLSTQIAERIAGKIAQRILGRVGAEFIPVAGWVIGLGLIVWDLWEGGQGALPQIQDALTSEAVKEKIRGEITDSIKRGLPDETALASLEIAVTLLEEWDGFCSRYVAVCELASENPTFQAILTDTPLDQLDKLALLVETVINDAGRAELNAAIESGHFEIALGLPTESYVILRSTHSLAALLDWARLAGDQLDRVVATGIYRGRAPADFTPALLNMLLAIDDLAAIDKLLALNQAELEQLATFAGPSLGPMASTMTLDELRQLLVYLQTPAPDLAQTPPADLAPKLASREVTVRELLGPAAAITNTGASTIALNTGQPSTDATPSPMGNSVVIGALSLSVACASGAWVDLVAAQCARWAFVWQLTKEIRPMNTVQTIKLIATNPSVRGGRPFISPL